MVPRWKTAITNALAEHEKSVGIYVLDHFSNS